MWVFNPYQVNKVMPEPNTHVFVVNDVTFTIHSKFQFCGVVNPTSDKERYGVYTDLLNMRVGDLVLFYQRFSNDAESDGFHGIYEVTGGPFFDSGDITDTVTNKTVHGKCECGSSFSPKRDNQFSPAKCLNCGRVLTFPILPNRIPIKPKRFFDKSVIDDIAYIDHTDYSVLWTMLFRKTTGAGRARSAGHILPEERDKLARLIAKANNGNSSTLNVADYPNSTTTRINLDIGAHKTSDGSLDYESVLHAWMMKNIDQNVSGLGEIIGDLDELEYFGSWVPYNLGTKTIDILCTHKRDGERYKATVIELKKDKVSKSTITQVNDYAPWIAQLVTENADPEVNEMEIQPVAIGFGRTRNLTLPPDKTMSVKYYSNSQSGKRETKTITIKQPKILSYSVNGDTLDIT